MPVLVSGVGGEQSVRAALAAGAHGVVLDLVREKIDNLTKLVSEVREVMGPVVSATAPEGAMPPTPGAIEAPGAAVLMTVSVNGEATAIAGGTTVGDLLDDREWARESVVVSIAGARVPRRRFDDLLLGEGDRVAVSMDGEIRE